MRRSAIEQVQASINHMSYRLGSAKMAILMHYKHTNYKDLKAIPTPSKRSKPLLSLRLGYG